MILAFRHHHSPILLTLSAMLLAIGFGALIGFEGWIGVYAILGLGLAGVVFLWPETAFVASFVTLIIGQLIRIPIGTGDSAIIPNDILIPALVIVWWLRKLGSRKWNIPSTSLTLPLVAMIMMFGLSLIINRSSVTSDELLSGAFYALRWVEYLAVLVMGYEFVRTQERARKYLWFLMGIGVAVSVLGFLQLRIYPDFSFMVPKGWDPHVGRLLSTWFDPNFLAGFLALLVTVALGVAVSKPFIQARWWWVAIMVMTLAIVLTYSRSGYVALAVGAGFITLMRARAVFFAGLLVCISIVLFVPRVQERVIGIRTVDETAQLRLVSWNNALSVISDHPWTGVGYNLYRFIQVKYGFVDQATEHSASGSDSSFLTMWVTTGIFGLLAYVWLFVACLREASKTWFDRKLDRAWQGVGLGLVGGLLGLFFHAQFVNSLLYPHIMQTVWLFLAIAIMIRQPEST